MNEAAIITDITINWHAVSDAFVWACIGFALALTLVWISDERARERRYVRELEARVRGR